MKKQEKYKQFLEYSRNVLTGKEKVTNSTRIKYFIFSPLIPLVSLLTYIIDRI